MDFFKVSERKTKTGLEIYPKFIVKQSKDLMIRGGDFYACYCQDTKLWTTDEYLVLHMIDEELNKYYEERKGTYEGSIRVLYLWDAETKSIDAWHKYCQKQMRDSFEVLDRKLVFANDIVERNDYASKVLPYPLQEGNISAYSELMDVLYDTDARMKIEWSIGSIITGDSKRLQKFLVLYGEAGTGKSTILNIVQWLFEGYYSAFDAKVLGSASNSFALEAFKTNPLVAIQHDGDLSRIEDNTRLNSLVSHEMMTVNEKFKSTYSNRFISFLMMGTNKPVKITDAKSGIIRRLIDVSPTGEKVNGNRYEKLMREIEFELGAIAWHCRNIYLNNKKRYDKYVPTLMMGATNDFYNFVAESFFIFKKEEGISLKSAWEMYKTFCEETNVKHIMPQRIFKEELRNYFWDYEERKQLNDGTRIRSYYSNFRDDKFGDIQEESEGPEETSYVIDFKVTESAFHKIAKDYPAQLANSKGTPKKNWDEVDTTLSQIPINKLHYVRPPLHHIVVDFDLKDSEGNKSLAINLEEASKFPPTYSELSKSGQGIHLHYFYDGDTNKLSSIYSENIEIKVFTGKSALRRQFTKCNDLDILTISSGLPLKGDKPVTYSGKKMTESGLRTLIIRNLHKEYHSATKPSMDFIKKILDEAYEDQELYYDVSDLKNAIFTFAASSTNNSEYCLELMKDMKFRSEDPIEKKEFEAKIVFYDVEVFPNLFVVCWKIQDDDNVVTWINPKSSDIESLIKYRLVGFNNRRYDNHMLYARLIGFTNEQIYAQSQKIITDQPNSFFGEAYNLSYTDIYDFSANKSSLKKLQIQLGLKHIELGLPWDQPVDEKLWQKVADYCANDVRSTEDVFKAKKADFMARQILAEIAGMSVNDTTNQLTTRIVFGKERNPQTQFNYRDMGNGRIDGHYKHDELWSKFELDCDFRMLPIFPGYTYEFGKSMYRGEKVGEGGYVYSEPGMYTNVALLDVASMHPTSIIQENLFGDIYTARYKELLDARVAIKHGDFDAASKMLKGVLAKYLQNDGNAKDLSYALKIALNSAYGLTAATYPNQFKDPRNIDNIVAKRGALFMINLKYYVQSLGYTVAHIKTDSIKIPNATPWVIKKVFEFGKHYGYDFEHEATYDKMCLVNRSVYVSRYKDGKDRGKWSATGSEFAHPYIMKNLFTHEDILFSDLKETKSSKKAAIYLDLNEHLGEEEHNYIFVGKEGEFTPVVDGVGGGFMYYPDGEKWHSVGGTKDQRWMESYLIDETNWQNSVDMSFYDDMLADSVNHLKSFEHMVVGGLDWFLSNDYSPDPIPLHNVPCGDTKYEWCDECPCKTLNGSFSNTCSKGYVISEFENSRVTDLPF